MITLVRDVYYVGFWYVEPASEEWLREHPMVGLADYFALLCHIGDEVHLQYRFRYYDQGGRESYQHIAGKDKQGGFEAARTVAETCAFRYESKLHYVPIDGDHEKAAQTISSFDLLKSTPIHDLN